MSRLQRAYQLPSTGSLWLLARRGVLPAHLLPGLLSLDDGARRQFRVQYHDLIGQRLIPRAQVAGDEGISIKILIYDKHENCFSFGGEWAIRSRWWAPQRYIYIYI